MQVDEHSSLARYLAYPDGGKKSHTVVCEHGTQLRNVMVKLAILLLFDHVNDTGSHT
jgi:hypothetical protein